MACRRYEAYHITRFRRFRLYADKVYNSKIFNYIIAFVIITNFATNIVEAEMAPDPSSHSQTVFDNLDYVFTIIYCLELACNIFVTGRRFLLSPVSSCEATCKT